MSIIFTLLHIYKLNFNQHIANFTLLKQHTYNYVQNDILVALEAGHSTALLLLHLSAAFDTIDHNILIHRLQHWFGISSIALNLMLSSFLSDRYQTVTAYNSKSQPVFLQYGVLQESVLEPLLFSLYTTPLLSVISKYPGIRSHFYMLMTPEYIYLFHSK